MIAPLTKFIDWSVLQTAEVIGCLGQMSLIFRMVFLATVPGFSFNARADSADGPQTIPQLQAAIVTVLKEAKSSAWRQQSVRRIIRRFASLGILRRTNGALCPRRNSTGKSGWRRFLRPNIP
jgi:hypothetical protein